MKRLGTKDPAPMGGSVMPWLHFGSTVPLFLIFSLWAAVHSELGRHIAPGESPAFAWVRHHIGLGLGLVLAARLLQDLEVLLLRALAAGWATWRSDFHCMWT